MITFFQRIIRLGFQNFFRNGGSTAATIFIIALTVSLVTSLFLLKEASRLLVARLQEKVDISVYIKNNSPETDVVKLRQEIAGLPEVKDVKYYSKEEALEEFSQRHKDDPLLIESLEEVGVNPFLASLNIKAMDFRQFPAIAGFLENSGFQNVIEKVDYYEREPVIKRISSLSLSLNMIGIVLAAILAAIAVLVTFTTIRLAIYNSGEEIRIQRLVGASNSFVRGPFLFQGAVAGFFAALMCFFLFFLLSWIFGPKAEGLLTGLNLFNIFTANIWTILFIQIITGVGLGTISSLLAIRRYLKV